MPYSGPGDPDLPANVKKLPAAKRAQWVEVWNDVYADCQAEGGEDCEGRAFERANGVVKEAGMEEAATFKSRVQGLTRDTEAILGDRNIPKPLRQAVSALRVALRRTWAELADEADGEEEDESEEMDEAKKKTVGGKSYPAGDFLVAEDPEKPSTWHLQVKRNGTPDHNLMGAAWAALHKGYRGNVYEGPGKQKAIGKLKALYKSEDMDVPSESGEMSDVAVPFLNLGPTTFTDLLAQAQDQAALDAARTLTYQFQDLAFNILASEIDRVAALRTLAEEYVSLVADALGEATNPVQAAEAAPEAVTLGESAKGAVLALCESEDVEEGRKPLELEIALIEPGWGNERDNHYYAPELLREYAGVFKGAKMYPTNHKPEEKNVLKEVSQILECPVRFTETGAPVARVGVFDNTFAESIRNRAALGTLDKLEVSIQATGTARPYEADGRSGKKILTISGEGANVDWVTKAGAGGRALRLLEAAATQEETMPEEERLEEEQPQPEEMQEAAAPPAEIEEGQEPAAPAEPVRLSEAEVETALEGTRLPDISRQKLAEAEYADQDALQAAIAAETAYVKELTGAGRPVGQERPQAQAVDTEKAYLAELDEIDRRYGVSRE